MGYNTPAQMQAIMNKWVDKGNEHSTKVHGHRDIISMECDGCLDIAEGLLVELGHNIEVAAKLPGAAGGMAQKILDRRSRKANPPSTNLRFGEDDTDVWG